MTVDIFTKGFDKRAPDKEKVFFILKNITVYVRKLVVWLQ